MSLVLTPTALAVVRRALAEGRIVLISVEAERGASGRFPGSDFQRIMSANDA